MADPALRFLVLDDETALVTALLSTLRESGHDVTGATTPSEALAKLHTSRFDVLLTDLNLPEMDGVAVLRAARALDPALITLVMTGHGSIDTAVDAMKAGAADYLLKPFKMRTVQMVIARAVTERKLRQQNESLHRQLAARTHELEAANKELEAFSYSVSHDLRAPLRAMASYAELLRESTDGDRPADIRDCAERIQRNARRMSAMVDDLLRMGRAFRKGLELGRVDLSACCREIAQKCQASNPQRQVEWIIPDNAVVTADPGLLTIALENLLNNAWKYTARRAVARIQVSVTSAQNEWTIAVADNGVGFEPAEATKLFAPFTRLRSAADFEGTGVGLATVQRIVHRHGGRIWAEATLGKGASFSFTLPQGSPAEASAAEPPADL